MPNLLDPYDRYGTTNALYLGPVGSERVGGDQSLTMPSPDVSPVVGQLGGHPVTAAANADAYRLAGNMLQFGPADVGAIRAFHGSPYAFDRFDTSKIGTGEGAQAYGHGLYFAGNEGTAKYYRDALTADRGVVTNWVDKSGNKLDFDALRSGTGPESDAASMLHQSASVDEAIADTKRFGPDAFIGGQKQMDSTLAQLQKWKDAGLTKQRDAGSMYEVALHADPEHFLDWDKPLSEQSQHVQDTLGGLGITSPKLKGSDAWLEAVSQHGLLREGAAAPASDMLRDAGIPGIRYLDAGSRGPMVQDLSAMTWSPTPGPWGVHGEMDPTTDTGWREFPTRAAAEAHADTLRSSNYVVFSPETIEILRRYGIAGLLGGGAAAGAASEQQ